MKCPVCGMSYEPNPKRLKWGRETTCSRSCSYKLRGLKQQKQVHLVCVGCGVGFTRPQSRTGQFCSTECAYANKKRGELAANWRGGKLSEQDKIRKSPEYKKWIQDVFARDDYTCQKCGRRGVKLNAHHVFPFANFPECRLETWNGVTLCVKCHKELHGKMSSVVTV